MKIVLQRVLEANVTVDSKIISQINQGYVILVGIEEEDSEEDADWFAKKVSNLRLFSDNEGKMNIDINEVQGDILVISQFTLHAKTKKGNRPSFVHAASPDKAEPLYLYFAEQLQKFVSQKVALGQFGADMKVALINDGPVTLVIDSKNKV